MAVTEKMRHDIGLVKVWSVTLEIPNASTNTSSRERARTLLTVLQQFICKGLSVQPPLSSKFAVKKTHINSIRASLSICIGFRSFVPEELDMNLTSLKVGIHRHCSINKLN